MLLDEASLRSLLASWPTGIDWLVLLVDVDGGAHDEVGERLAAAIPDAWVYRGAGGGFVVLVSQCRTRREAMAVGEQVRRTVGDAVAVSIGAALSVDVDGGGEALWQQASACLDAAKAAGRDQVVVHQPA